MADQKAIGIFKRNQIMRVHLTLSSNWFKLACRRRAPPVRRSASYTVTGWRQTTKLEPCLDSRLTIRRITTNAPVVIHKTWVDYLPRTVQPYLYLTRIDKPIGTLLLFYPC